MGRTVDLSTIKSAGQGVNSDRAEIIEIVVSVMKENNYSHFTDFIKLLNDKIFPHESKQEIQESSYKLHRILHWEKFSRNDDHVEGISFKKLRDLLENKFVLKKKEIQLSEIHFGEEMVKNHDDYFIYYYVSFEQTLKQLTTKFALIGFDLGFEGKEWQTGSVYYFNKNKIDKVFMLERLSPADINVNTLFFCARHGMQVNFFTIKIHAKDRQKRGILPLAYSVLEVQLPCSGKGFLERCDDNNYLEKIKLLISNGISADFINLLHLKKFVLEELVFENAKDFINPSARILKEYFHGIWTGFYFRPDYTEKAGSKPGGIYKFALYVKESGECELHFNSPEENVRHCYEGFIGFPFENAGIIKISLEYNVDKKIHRLNMFLSTVYSQIKSYVGVIAGWTTGNLVYSSPVYMERTTKFRGQVQSKQVHSEIREIAPRQIPKINKVSLSKEELEMINTLREIESNHIGSSNNSFN
jgi:hypothetical protein